MKLSTKTRYGLRAMIDLAKGYGTGKPISISEVAREQSPLGELPRAALR